MTYACTLRGRENFLTRTEELLSICHVFQISRVLHISMNAHLTCKPCEDKIESLQNNNVKLPKFAWTENGNPDGKLIIFLSATLHHELMSLMLS